MSWSTATTTPRGEATLEPVVRVLSTPHAIEGEVAEHALRPREPFTVGRADDVSLVLRDGRVSRKHLTLLYDDDRRVVTVEDSSANGTTVNGRGIKRAIVRDGDVVRLGDTFLMMRLVPSIPEDAEVRTVLGDAPAMRALRKTLTDAGPSGSTVLIVGESGTGREVIARALHELSGRSGPFVSVDCSAISEDLAESDLFGGDAHGPLGYYHAADRGTLFLDELGELPASVQGKLLRAIEDGAITPASGRPIPVDVRVVAAADRDIERLVREGDLQSDLYRRLTEVIAYVPPLRERREDILTLLQRSIGDTEQTLEPGLVDALLSYKWPFNVRELVKVAKELRLRGQGLETLTLDLVEARLRKPESAGETGETAKLADGGVVASTSTTEPSVPPKKEDKPPPTRDQLVEILTRSKGNISQASRETGRSRRQVYRYLEEHGLTLDDFRDG